MPADIRPIDAQGAFAVHTKDGDGADFVCLGNLRVLITKHEDGWLAQGLEIDYAIDGTTVDDVKARFEDGLALTIQSHLRVHNDIKRLLKNAPQPIWEKFYAVQPPDEHHAATVTVRLMPRGAREALRFDKIIYAQAA